QASMLSLSARPLHRHSRPVSARDVCPGATMQGVEERCDQLTPDKCGTNVSFMTNPPHPMPHSSISSAYTSSSSHTLARNNSVPSMSCEYSDSYGSRS
ncbi:hypothetical protein ADUPG1_005551, partial [Aduncisulcus paluster]